MAKLDPHAAQEIRGPNMPVDPIPSEPVRVIAAQPADVDDVRPLRLSADPYRTSGYQRPVIRPSDLVAVTAAPETSSPAPSPAEPAPDDPPQISGGGGGFPAAAGVTRAQDSETAGRPTLSPAMWAIGGLLAFLLLFGD